MVNSATRAPWLALSLSMAPTFIGLASTVPETAIKGADRGRLAGE